MILEHSVLTFLLLAWGENLPDGVLRQIKYDLDALCFPHINPYYYYTIKSFNKTSRPFEQFETCVADIAELEHKELTRKMFDGNFRDHLNEFCTKSSEVKACIHNLFKIQEICGSPYVNITKDALDHGVDFACQDDGYKIFEFKVNDGYNHISNRNHLKECYNLLNASDINGTYGNMSECVVNFMGINGNRVLKVIAHELFAYVQDRLNNVPLWKLPISWLNLILIVVGALLLLIILILSCYKFSVSRISVNHGSLRTNANAFLYPPCNMANDSKLVRN